MFCWAMEIGLFGSRIVFALKEPYIPVDIGLEQGCLVWVEEYLFFIVTLSKKRNKIGLDKTKSHNTQYVMISNRIL